MWWWLAGCAPQPEHPTPTPATPAAERHWVQVSAQPCALDRYGIVTCWGDGSRNLPFIPSNTDPVSVFTNHRHKHLWGIGLDGFPVNWHCGYEWPPPECSVPQHEFSQIGSGNALDLHGVLGDWDSGGPVYLPFGEEIQTLFAPIEDASVSLSEENIAHFFSDKAVGIFTHAFNPDSEYVEIAPYGIAICVLDSEGNVECAGEPWSPNQLGEPLPTFDSPPYVDIAGESYAVCAKRADEVIECHDGQTYDFGPVHDFATAMYPNYRENQPTLGYRPGANYALCVITMDDAIECVGSRYPQELLDRLPTGPPE